MNPHLLLRRDQIVVNQYRIRQAGDVLEQVQRTSATALSSESQQRLQMARSLIEDVFHDLTSAMNELNSEILHRPDVLLSEPMNVQRRVRG